MTMSVVKVEISFPSECFLHLLLKEVSMEGVHLREYFCKNKLSRFKLFEDKGI